MNKQKRLPPFPKVGLSGTQYDKDAYSKLTPMEKLEEGFIKDPDVVYHCAMDDIKYIDDYAQINGIKIPIGITKYNMLRSCSSFTYRSDLVVKEALSVSIKPSVIQEGTTATLVAKFNGKEVEAVYTTDSELIEIVGSTVSVKKDAAPGSAIINATYTKPAVTDEENTEIEPAKEFTAKVTVKVTAIPVTKPTININGTEPTIFAGGTATISVTAVKGNKHDITEVKLDDGTVLNNTSGNVYETTVTPSATKTYTVTVKDAGNQTATIKIKVTVQQNVLVINGSNPTSADGTTTLTAMLNGVEAPSDTTWEITGDGAILNETTGSSVTLTGQNVDTASSKTVTVTATTTSGISATKNIVIPAKEVGPANSYYGFVTLTGKYPFLNITEEKIKNEGTEVMLGKKEFGEADKSKCVAIVTKNPDIASQYLFYAYPARYGDLTEIGMFTVSWEVSQTWLENKVKLTVNNEEYNVYINVNKVTPGSENYECYFK